MRTSRLPQFYKLSLDERLDTITKWANLSETERERLCDKGLSNDAACEMIENVIGTFALPVGVASNLIVNGREYLVPMVVEEASVVAAASHGAKLTRTRGGFTSIATEPVMIGQVQILECPDVLMAARAVMSSQDKVLLAANKPMRGMAARGGGAFDIETRVLESRPGQQLVVHILFKTCDAMGANAVNSGVEAAAPLLGELTKGRVNLRILTNLADRRLVRVTCSVPAETFGQDGNFLAAKIVEASDFAVADIYRATTHNKGILNAVDAICLATGNDWRAVEAGAHAYAARAGNYGPLSTWTMEAGELIGSMELPLAVGIVGGATTSHPVARIALKILGVQSAVELAEVIASVGLAENLASLKALASEGIQRGHMRLHAGQIALAAEADGNCGLKAEGDNTMLDTGAAS